MIRIDYTITSGTFPITVELIGGITLSNIHYSPESGYFTNVPEGDYEITFTDSENCTGSELIYWTTTTTTTEQEATTTTTTTIVEPCIVEYGLLYNWYAATDVRNISSSDDWVVPTTTQWNTLQTYLGGITVSGGKMKEIGITYWQTPNWGATNEVGFNGRGNGYRDASTGLFGNKTGISYIHSTTVKRPWVMYSINADGLVTNLITDGGKDGFAIRLLKTSTTLSDGEIGTYIGNDGHVYRTICIGTQEWLADNLMETQFRNGNIIPYHGVDNTSNFTNAEWTALTTAGVCDYDNDVANVGCDFQFPEEVTTTTTTVP